MSRRRRALAAAVVLLALSACGDDDDAVDTAASTTASGAPTEAPSTTVASPAPATSAAAGTGAPGEGDGVSAADLDGRTFLATEATGHGLVAGSEVRLVFADGSMSGSGGCNSLVATPYSVDGDELVVEGPMGMTEMACDPPALMDQDAWLAELITGRPALALDGDTLTLTGAESTATFVDREVADPDRPLEGTAWELDSLISADAVSSVPAGIRTPTLSVEGGEMSVDLGCNTGSGPVTVGEGTLEIGPLASTLMLCQGDSGDVETHLLSVLEGTVDYTIEADRLTLMNGDAGAVYRAAG